jgi:hypothetical protein
MRRLLSIAITPLLLTVVPTETMAGPPTQLYGKSILYRWMHDVDFKTVDGHSKHAIGSTAVGMYISTRGRIIAHNPSGRLALSNHKVSGQSCTITDGNMFGGNSE